jgi:arylsulfatase A-like enzyme
VGHRLTSRQNLGEMLFVPLFIKEPQQTEGQTSTANATSLDILPTVADILGLSLPWQAEGRSLRGVASPPRGEKRFLGKLHAARPAVFQER